MDLIDYGTETDLWYPNFGLALFFDWNLSRKYSGRPRGFDGVHVHPVHFTIRLLLGKKILYFRLGTGAYIDYGRNSDTLRSLAFTRVGAGLYKRNTNYYEETYGKSRYLSR